MSLKCQRGFPEGYDPRDYPLQECYTNVLRYGLWLKSIDTLLAEDAKIVHGRAIDFDDDRPFNHAWLELYNGVYDPTFGIACDREEWYSGEVAFSPLKQVGLHYPVLEKRYDLVEAIKLWMRKKRPGPWHKGPLGPRLVVLPDGRIVRSDKV